MGHAQLSQKPHIGPKVGRRRSSRKSRSASHCSHRRNPPFKVRRASGRIVADNNRLQEVKQNNIAIATYTYNGKGERVKKETSETVNYFYNQQGQLISELDGQGNTIRDYIYLGGEPLALIENNNIYYYHNDHIGTPQFLTDSNQQIAWAADYEPFGKATITTETITNNIRFRGQYFDIETGRHYNYFRYYDPMLGRYVTSDPIGLRGGINTYGYVSSNPLINIDPLGLIKWTGTQTTAAAGEFGGAVLFLFTLETDCVNGKKGKVEIRAGGGAAVLGLPVSATYSREVEFTDNLNEIDTNVFNGQAIYSYASYALIFAGASYQHIQLGGATATGLGSQFGYDASIVSGVGWSNVMHEQVIDCDCE